MRYARRLVAGVCIAGHAACAGGCGADWGCGRGSWGCNTGWHSGYWNASGCGGDPAVVVVYAAVVVVAIVVDGTVHLVSDIREHFRDGGDGIAWDSAEGRRLRGE